MENLLTVTIPSYRQPEQLLRALTALSLQTYKKFSVLIIDDKSGVDLKNLIIPFERNLSISIVENENNLGAMKNILNSITFDVSTPYILSHHEDDFLKSNYLEEAVTVLEKDPSISFVLSSGVWVKKNYTFTDPVMILDTTVKKLSSKEFSFKSLSQEPFIFGSVIYRKKDITGTFDLETYHTLCDKIFLSNILIKNDSYAAYIKEPAIYVRNHSLDEADTRSDGSKIIHLINFFRFYQKELEGFSPKTPTLITNGLLFGYTHFAKTCSLYNFYKEQKKYNLLKLSEINTLGFYSLASLVTGKKTLSKFLSMVKKIN